MSVQPQNATARGARDGAAADPRRLEKARSIIVSLSKYAGAKTIYAGNGPVVEKFRGILHEALRSYFEGEKELSLSVEQYQLKWRDEVVYDNREKKESLAFLLFKDGVGEITFQDAVSPEELERFVDLIRAEIGSTSGERDVVDRLWQAEFTHITYRVFDEAADGKPGEGTGGGGSGEDRLSLDDHPDLTGGGRGGTCLLDQPHRPLGQHLRLVIERDHPGATPDEKENYLQQLLEALFQVRDEDLERWRRDFAARGERDKLLRLLESMLDFTRSEVSAAAASDILEIVERLVRYMAAEADIPTLFAILDIEKRLAERGGLGGGFEAVPQRIRHELTGSAFLLSLGRKAGRSRGQAPKILEYLGRLGNNAVPALREILSVSADESVHEQTCDLLSSIARDYIMPIIDDLDIDNPLEALDAVCLLSRCGAGEIPPIIEKIVSSPHAQARRRAIGYLARIGGDQAAPLLCRLLDDADPGVRTEALAAAEGVRHPTIVARITSLCFDEDIAAGNMEELERRFRALGKVAAEEALPRIREMASERSFLSIHRNRARRSKLLAVTALRHIPGPDALEMLDVLARDGDALVRSKALHALDLLEDQAREPVPEEAAATEGGEA